ncbi:unnamed protein product [Bursaphelenchus xylophilus]|uniref:(pine wood nematode) hypothetical protein n=1 Tax=Bursaphelenchus xylophilus TaxID=6326 RepID=A0A1I7S493_BURXY|nr:unnamed protein product [Bursaphelenchus xylophilus]CAG9116855.1 unnamed protein product [Bursaphelenchus xylophilus]
MSVDQAIDQSSQDFEQVRALFAAQKITLNGRAETGNQNVSVGSSRASPQPPRKPTNLPPLPRKPALLKRPPLASKPIVTEEMVCGTVRSVKDVVRQFDSQHSYLTGNMIPSVSVEDKSDGPKVDSEDSDSDYSDDFADVPSRKNSFIGPTKQIHSSIMEELKTKGILKKLSVVQPILPPDVGRMRPQSSKVNRAAQNSCKSEPPPPPKKPASFDGEKEFDRRLTQQFLSVNQKKRIESPTSLESSPSTSTLSEDVDLEIFEYKADDEKESRRLKDLHGLIHEFYKMQKNYVELLRNIAVYFPNYIDGFIRRTNRQALIPPSDGRPHVLERLARHLNLILNVHQVFLTEFGQKYQKWDSRQPDFASVFLKLADYLKICSEFLKEKQGICEELTKALEDNRDLAHVTKLFEDEVLNAQNNADQTSSTSSLASFTPRGISLVMHLDGVHQNVVRYNLLMERYQKLLPSDSEEHEIAEKALKRLKVVSETINIRLADADSNRKMMELHRKLQGCFDVFAPGRRLVFDCRLMKQSRRELQERHLVLFTDYLLICRYSLGSDYFDTQRIYRIPVEQLRTHVEEHADYEKEFAVINPKKSHIFLCKSRLERDQLVKRLDQTINEWRNVRKMRRPRTQMKLDPQQLPVIESASTTPVAEEKEIVKDALWIPDNKATKCLMAGCESKFSVVVRRHHCRNCGWLICRRCVGYAPVRAKNFESVKVCPECFDRLWLEYLNMDLFPTEMIQLSKPTLLTQIITKPGITLHNTINSVWNYPTEENEPPQFNGNEELAKTFKADPLDDIIRIMYDNGRRAERPKDLFKPPQNQHLRRVSAPTAESEKKILATGKVFLRSRRVGEQVKYARFHQNLFLNFYDAEFDGQPIESYLIHGFNYKVEDADNGGTIFTLEHQNQIKTDRKSIRIEFRIENQKAVDQWQQAFEDNLPKTVQPNL